MKETTRKGGGTSCEHGLQVDGGLRSRYWKTISERLTPKKLPILQGISEKVIEGKEDPSTLVDEAMDGCYSCLTMKSTELRVSQS